MWPCHIQDGRKVQTRSPHVRWSGFPVKSFNAGNLRRQGGDAVGFRVDSSCSLTCHPESGSHESRSKGEKYTIITCHRGF